MPLLPLTVTVTVVLCAVVMLDGFAETVTAGVVVAVTVTALIPEELL